MLSRYPTGGSCRWSLTSIIYKKFTPLDTVSWLFSLVVPLFLNWDEESGASNLNTARFPVVRQTIEATEREIIHVSFSKPEAISSWRVGNFASSIA